MNVENYFLRGPKALVVATLAIGLAGAGFAASHLAESHAVAQIKMASPDEGPSRTGFAPVIKKVLPAVVKIESTKFVKASDESMGDMQDNPLFRQFFGNGDEGGSRQQFRQKRQTTPQEREEGVGSGVIMTPDGYILTNNHVVDSATQIKVLMIDGRQFTGKVIGADAKSDIAVVKIDATNLPSVTVADSSKLQIGDYALAVGNPFGVGQTVTMGIVSATGRTHLGIEEYEDFIQTDAPINPGNSGGALVNDRGELIGINTAIISHGSSGNQGIGFAIPVNEARNVMDQLVTHGKVTRAYLGVVPQDVTPSIAKAFGQAETRGALIGDVSPNSPAQKGGLEKGDIVVAVNGRPIADANQLRMTISMMQPDANVKVGVVRSGAQHEFSVQLGELPSETASVAKPASENGTSALSGVSVEDLDAQAAHQLGLPPNAQGVVVTEIDPSSHAAEAGLQRGDVIQEVNRKAVKNSSDFERAVHGSNSDALLLVNRNGNTLYVAA